MNDISNRTLALFLVAAIVLSAGSMLIFLDRGSNPTGYATSGTGTVDLDVTSTLAITMEDNSIDYGECTLLPGVTTYVDSALNSSNVNNTQCTLTGWADVDDSGNNAGDWIQVQNYGNIPAKVTFTSDTIQNDFFTGDQNLSKLRYKTAQGLDATNTSTTGCASLGSEAEIDSTSTNFSVCTSLASGPQGLVRLYTEADMTYDVTGTTNQVTLTFLAETV